MERKKSRLFWQVSKLVLFAPWSEARLSDRVVSLSSLIVVNGVLSPMARFVLKRQYRACLEG
jgi:hypothetical protein